MSDDDQDEGKSWEELQRPPWALRTSRRLSPLLPEASLQAVSVALFRLRPSNGVSILKSLNLHPKGNRAWRRRRRGRSLEVPCANRSILQTARPYSKIEPLMGRFLVQIDYPPILQSVTFRGHMESYNFPTQHLKPSTCLYLEGSGASWHGRCKRERTCPWRNRGNNEEQRR